MKSFALRVFLTFVSYTKNVFGVLPLTASSSNRSNLRFPSGLLENLMSEREVRDHQASLIFDTSYRRKRGFAGTLDILTPDGHGFYPAGKDEPIISERFQITHNKLWSQGGDESFRLSYHTLTSSFLLRGLVNSYLNYSHYHDGNYMQLHIACYDSIPGDEVTIILLNSDPKKANVTVKFDDGISLLTPTSTSHSGRVLYFQNRLGQSDQDFTSNNILIDRISPTIPFIPTCMEQYNFDFFGQHHSSGTPGRSADRKAEKIVWEIGHKYGITVLYGNLYHRNHGKAAQMMEIPIRNDQIKQVQDFFAKIQASEAIKIEQKDGENFLTSFGSNNCCINGFSSDGFLVRAVTDGVIFLKRMISNDDEKYIQIDLWKPLPGDSIDIVYISSEDEDPAEYVGALVTLNGFPYQTGKNILQEPFHFTYHGELNETSFKQIKDESRRIVRFENQDELISKLSLINGINDRSEYERYVLENIILKTP